MISTALCAQLACIWEATARKPGNVHRYQDFTDLTYTDLIMSAAAIAPVLETAPTRRVGETILEGVRATRRLVQTNTNLGILLLLAPLAAVARDTDLRRGLPVILDQFDLADARALYQAILVARQYSNAFHEVMVEGVPALERGLDQVKALEGAIIYCHLHLMAAIPDSLIARKQGAAEAAEASRRAQRTLVSGWPTDRAGREALADLDTWLRAKGNRRNPGTTADLVTATLFIALREGILEVPCRFPFSMG